MSRKQIFLTYLGFVTLLLITTFVVMRQSGVSHDFIDNVVARFLMRDRFHLNNAGFDLAEGKVTIEGLEVSGTGGTPLVAVESVEVAVTTNPLGDVGSVQEIKLSGLKLSLDVSSGELPDLAGILRESEAAVGAPTDLSGNLPPIYINDSVVTLILSKNGHPVEFTEVNLSLSPLTPESTTMVLKGTMRSPSGFEVTVSGSGDVAQSDFRALLEIEKLPLTPKIAEAYSRDIEKFLAQAGISGTAEKLAIWLEYSGSASAFDAGVRIELKDIDCAAPQIPYPLKGATAQITASTKSNGTLKFFLDSKSVDGDIDVQGTFTELFGGKPAYSTRLQAHDVLVGPNLKNTLLSQSFLAPIWEAFKPTSGRVSADLRVWNAEPGSKAEVALDLDLDGVTGAYYGFPRKDGEPISFPHTVSNGTGRIQSRGHTIYVRGMRMGVGTGEMTVTGAIALPVDGQALKIDLDLDGRRIPFTKDIRDALQVLLPEAAAYYDEYAPEGEARAKVGLHTVPETGNLGVTVSIQPLGAAATFQGFPYRVENLTGLVEISSRGTSIDLAGVRENAKVDVYGRFRMPPSGSAETEMRSELWIKAQNITLDPELARGLAALGPELGQMWTAISPRGKAACELSLWRDSNGEDWKYDVRVDLESASIEVNQFPVRITDLKGPLFVHGTGSSSRVEVSAVKGIVPSQKGTHHAQLLVQGIADLSDSGTRLNLTSVVRHLAIDEQLASALHDNGAFKRSAWDIMSPSGFVDVIARLDKTETQSIPEFSLRLHLDGVGSQAKFLPSNATDLFGEVTVANGIASLHDVRGKIGRASIQLPAGSVRGTEGATMITAKISSPEFPVDHRLAKILSGPMKQTYLDRGVSGSLKVSELNLGFRFPDDGSDFTSRASGRFSSHNLRLRLGAELQNITGSWNIEDARFENAGGFVTGGLENGALTILAHRIESIRTRFHIDPDKVSFQGIRARLHNGKLQGVGADDHDLSYEFTSEGKLSFDLSWTGISLSEMMRHAGVPGDPYHGNLSGELHLKGLEGEDIVEAQATGSMNIAQGRLGEVPLFTSIYSYLSPNRRPRFDSASLNFSMHGREIQIDKFTASSPLLAAEGKGTVTLDGYVNMSMDFPDLFGKKADWLILPPVVRTLTNSVVGFQIYGYLRAPKARPRWLWQDKPDRVPLGPIPARRPATTSPRK